MSIDQTDREAPAATDGKRLSRGNSKRSTPMILLFARLLFMALVLATPALVVGSRLNTVEPGPFLLVVGLTLASGALGLIVVVIDTMTPNKRLASIFGIYLGICLGLVGAYALGTLLDSIVAAWGLQETNAALYLGLAKVSIGLILCYTAVSVVMTTKDDFRLVIPYVEFSKQNRGVRPMALDTSAIIDGRIHELSESGALDAPFVVLQPVIDELQRLADSNDKNKRTRGRRGLDMVAKMQSSGRIDITIEDAAIDAGNVDRGLVDIAKLRGYRVVTTDAALTKVAEIAGVTAINVNRIAGSLRAQAIAGDRLEIEITRPGENPAQGVGHLSDGTMVVIENGASHVGETVSVVVTNTLTTSAGRMIFARVEDAQAEPGSAASMAARATAQPKHREGGPGREDDGRGSGRNPRRG
jgi:uncharacterized protein YacL